nr:MAG TPA: Repressor protein CI [Caudoviricetes sp.]DAU42637.1 MAG TPA: Repressor protein CI [Caudoviricetes sp.]
MKKSDFASRLSQALEARGMKAADLSKKTKVAEGTISCYINGRYEAKQNRVQVFAEALDVNPAWLMGYDVPMEAERSQPAPAPRPIPKGFEPMPKMKKIPLVGSIACGTPILAQQNIEKIVDVPENIRCDFSLTCHGDSMEGAGIHDRDVVYIRIQPEVENGEIAAVRIGEEATLKRVYYQNGTLTLMPANAAYAPMVYTGPELNDVQIEGKAVGWTHWVG